MLRKNSSLLVVKLVEEIKGIDKKKLGEKSWLEVFSRGVFLTYIFVNVEEIYRCSYVLIYLVALLFLHTLSEEVASYFDEGPKVEPLP